MFNEKLKADLLFLDNIPALHVLGVFSEYSLLVPVRTKNPQEVRDTFRNSSIGVLALRGASRWMRVANGRKTYGLNCLLNDATNCYFKGLVRAPGFLSVAIDLRAELIIA